MRRLSLLLLLLCSCGCVWAEEVTIFDYQTGRHHSYSVRPGGSVFDYSTGRYSYPNYSLQQTGRNTWLGYDYNSNTFQNYRLYQGGASVFDYGTARYYNYGVSPSPRLYQPVLPNLLPPLW